MLVALEGSSPTIRGENNFKYYVWNAYQGTNQSEKIYEKGPAAISWGWSPINIRKMADTATSFIRAHNSQIFLIGWSRGAAACIQVALDLERGGFSRPVDAMFLFDAVDQDGSTNDFLNFIPGNVRTVYHAIAIKKSWLDNRIFPTCGRTSAPGVNVVAKEFNTSHGGIAGADSKLGDAGSREWMWDNLKREGVI
jgi:pimeloyl-ACP methyl ester carboxylesterase